MGKIAERALRKEPGLATPAKQFAKAERRDTITIYRFADGSATITSNEGWWDMLEGDRKARHEIGD